MDLDDFGVCSLRRRSACGLSFRASYGVPDMGSDSGDAVETGFFLVLENYGRVMGPFGAACEKNFIFYENFVCIC